MSAQTHRIEVDAATANALVVALAWDTTSEAETLHNAPLIDFKSTPGDLSRVNAGTWSIRRNVRILDALKWRSHWSESRPLDVTHRDLLDVLSILRGRVDDMAGEDEHAEERERFRSAYECLVSRLAQLCDRAEARS